MALHIFHLTSRIFHGFFHAMANLDRRNWRAADRHASGFPLFFSEYRLPLPTGMEGNYLSRMRRTYVASLQLGVVFAVCPRRPTRPDTGDARRHSSRLTAGDVGLVCPRLYWTYSTVKSITWICCTLLACSLQTPPSLYNCNPSWMEIFETLDNLVFEIHDYHGQVYSNQTPVKQKFFAHCKGCNFPLSQMTVNPKLQIHLWFLQSSSWDYIPRITVVGFVETCTTGCLYFGKQ